MSMQTKPEYSSRRMVNGNGHSHDFGSGRAVRRDADYLTLATNVTYLGLPMVAGTLLQGQRQKPFRHSQLGLKDKVADKIGEQIGWMHEVGQDAQVRTFHVETVMRDRYHVDVRRNYSKVVRARRI